MDFILADYRWIFKESFHFLFIADNLRILLTTPSRFWGQSVVEFQMESPLKIYKLTTSQQIPDSY